MKTHFRELQDYLHFRYEFLIEEYIKNNNNLQCVYCGRDNLDIGERYINLVNINNENENLATIDHITPFLKGVDRLNKDICVVSCKSCNKKKDSIDPSVIKAPSFGNMRIDTYKTKHFTGDLIINSEIKIKTLKKSYNLNHLINILLPNDYNLIKICKEKKLNYIKKYNNAFYLSDKYDFDITEKNIYRLSSFWNEYDVHKDDEKIDLVPTKLSLCENIGDKSYKHVYTEKLFNRKINKIENKNLLLNENFVLCEMFEKEIIDLDKTNNKIYNINDLAISINIDYTIIKYIIDNYNYYHYSSKTHNLYIDNSLRLSNNWIGTNLENHNNCNFHLAKYISSENRFELILKSEHININTNKNDLIHFKKLLNKERISKQIKFNEYLNDLIISNKLIVQLNDKKYNVSKFTGNKLHYIDDNKIKR